MVGQGHFLNGDLNLLDEEVVVGNWEFCAVAGSRSEGLEEFRSCRVWERVTIRGSERERVEGAGQKNVQSAEATMAVNTPKEDRVNYTMNTYIHREKGGERLVVCALVKLVAHQAVQIHFGAAADGDDSRCHLRHQPFDQTRDPQKPSCVVFPPNGDCWAHWLRGKEELHQVDTSLCPYHYETLSASWELRIQKKVWKDI